MNRRLVCTLALCAGVVAVGSAPAWGWGMYNWWGGYTTATATSWNGGSSVSWNYGPSGWGWGWGGGAQVSTYTNTYPAADADSAWGWNGAACQSHSATPGRTADAYASAYNSNWSWWNSGGYSYARTQTSGVPSYATAYARSNSNWSYQYWVPRSWWYNSWVPQWGWRVPYYMRWYYWGWLDGDQSDMGVEMNLWADQDGSKTSVLRDGFHDNGDGTYTQVGSALSGSDLMYNPDVGGTGHAGWDILGHDGSQGQDPYQLEFLMNAREIGGDTENILLEVSFSIDGYIGQVPEPATGLLLLAATLGLWLRPRRR